MSNRNVNFFRDYLRVLGACVSYAETARRLGVISENWVYKCLAASKAASAMPEVPSVFLFEAEADDGEPRWFHEHVRAAVTNSIEAIEAAARSRALHGTYTVAQYKGQTVYKVDPALISFSDEDLEAYGFPDRYLRIDGKLQPELVWQPPSTDLVLGILGAHSKRYRKANAGTTVNVNAQSGVQIVERRKPELPAPLPMVTNVDPADYAEIDEPDLAVTDTDPDALPVAPAIQPEDRPEPGPVIREATPPEYAPEPAPILASQRAGRPLSDLERDLLSKLPKDNSAARAAPKSRTPEL
jgi:hypothetical protein